MNRRRQVVVFLGALVLFLAAVGSNLLADGFIIPHPPRPGDVVPPLTVKYHHVKVEIRDQVAKTTIDQVFINNFNRDIEGTYIFPLPEQASISEFAMWIGDKRVEGEILDSQQARRVYEDIVRRMRDPALLEYIGRNMFRARVYPIPAMGEKRIQLSYSEVLRAEKNFVRYRYPLNTEQFSYKPIQDVSISVKIASQAPISNIYSPSHKVSVRKEGEKEATASYEEANTRPDKDFFLYYSFSQEDVGLSFINWAGSGAGAGAGAAGPDDRYFMLLASPRYTEQKERVMNKNLIFALDSSGSMSGTKIKQAKEAARFIINHLDENDRFSIIDFDDGVSLFSEELLAARSANKDRALKFVDGIQDSGGTNINEALLKALKLTRAGERPNYVVFLTDGLPTVGITETAEILKNIVNGNETKSRIFVFGVGNDVNTELLDKISSQNRGTSVYVGESENLEVAVSSYFEKIASPLLSDLKLVFRGVEVQSVYPQALPDLFKGSQLVLIGKYTGEGPVTAILTGKVGKAEKQFVIEGIKLTKENTYNFLPRLWATRRIGYLLEEIRLHGASGASNEVVDEVTKLGMKFGIVTPYTSFLVTEKERLRIDAAAPESKVAFEAGKVSGAGAVRVAKATQALKAEDLASRAASEQIRYKDDKTFYLKNGIWVDSLYKEGGALKEIKFNSDEYFRLLTEKPGLAKYAAVGIKLIVCFEGVNYRISE